MERISERGISLVETMVVVLLFGVIGAAVTAVVIVHLRSIRSVEDATRAADDVRLAVERVSKELRAAEQVLPLAAGQTPAAVLRFWIDDDADGARVATEEIAYTLVPVGDRVELHRSTTAAPTPTVVVRNLTMASRFEYDSTSPTSARVVTVTAEADGAPGRDAAPVRVQTAVRLRNAR